MTVRASSLHPQARIRQAAKLCVDWRKPIGVKYHTADELRGLVVALSHVPPGIARKVKIVRAELEPPR